MDKTNELSSIKLALDYNIKPFSVSKELYHSHSLIF